MRLGVRVCAVSSTAIGLFAAFGCTSSADDSAEAPTRDPARTVETASPNRGSAAPLDASCPTVAGLPASSVPASLHAAGAPDQWFGADGLWVSGPSVGLVPGEVEGRHRLKYGSFTLDREDAMTDAFGAPEVEAERVDGPGRGASEVGGFASAASGTGEPLRFWPTTVEFPSSGCWLVTERSHSTVLRFLIRVP